MNERTIAAIALSNRDFPTFQAKLEEAVGWIELAARQGADLAVLPEALNYYRGDGAGNPDRPTPAQAAFDDWRRECAVLIDAARRCGIAVVVPVITREPAGHLANVFYLVDREGQVLGRYQKQYPTPEEIDAGVQPGGAQPPIVWTGLRVGGAICFDTCFAEAIERQAADRIDLLIAPSLWPGGTQLDHWAREHEFAVALAYPAWSRVLDKAGREVAAAGYRHETLRFGFGSPVALATVNFDVARLYANHNQEKMAEVQRQCGADMRVTFDQPNCTFYLESRSPHLSAGEVLERFGLMRHRDYFADARRKRDALVHGGDVLHEMHGIAPAATPRRPSPIVQVRKLVADGRHNAFTDLLRWRGALYLTYRRSSGHGETDGDVVLLRSTDRGQTWQEVQTGLRDSHNFYEGHLCELGDELLMFGGSFRRGGKLDKSTQQEFVSRSRDGLSWSAAQPVYQPKWRFWRPIRVGDELFAAAYRVDYSGLQPNGRIPARYWTVKLVRSADGVDWQDVSTLSDCHGGNETELLLEDDGLLRAYIRCESPPGHLLERHSRPPYTEWSEPVDGGQVVQGQAVRDVHGRRFMVGRHRPCSSRLSTIAERRDWIRTKVWVHEDGYWVDYATLPSGGDTSYAGILPLDDQRMLVSYYSQHDEVSKPGFRDMSGASNIYLAILRTDCAADWGTTAAGNRTVLGVRDEAPAGSGA